MKNLLLITLLTLFSLTNKAQNWIWANSADGYFYKGQIISDAQGNVYIVGSFESPVLGLGNIILKNVDSTENYMNVFIAKYDASGNIKWAKSAGGNYDDFGTGIAVDKEGNTYMTGYFGSSSITFDKYTLINSSGGPDANIFVVKFDSSGNVIWANRAGGDYNDESNGIAIDSKNNVYITGFFSSSPIYFGNISLNDTTPGNDIFTAKYNASGNALWARRGNGIGGINNSNSIATDGNNSVYIAGYFESAITFDKLKLFYPNSFQNIFVTKYDSSGNVLWVRGAADSLEATCNNIATDNGGNVYLTGYSSTFTIAFGNDTVEGGIFFVKYDSLGHVLWAKGINYQPSGLSTDGAEAFLTGYFKARSIDIEGNIFLNTDTSGKTDDFLVIKYDGSGKFLSGMKVGGTFDDESTSIYVNNSDIYIMGGFSSPSISFANNMLLNKDTTGNTYNGFVAEYGFPNSITEVSNIAAINIYPNPSNGIFYLATSKRYEDKVSIYNLLGEVIYETNVLSYNSKVDLSNLPAGMYVLKLRTAEGPLLAKLIKD